MPPFPFFFLTWRESVFGFKPMERVAMQIEMVTPQGVTTARGSLGYVKWNVEEEIVEHTFCLVLHGESGESKTGRRQTEDIWVDATTSSLVRQTVSRPVDGGVEKADSVFFPDHVDTRRTRFDGTSEWFKTELPAGRSAVLDQRFAPLTSGVKSFEVFDGFTGDFRRVSVESGGRFAGTVSGEKYEGQTYRFAFDGIQQKMMLTSEGEVVKIEFTRDISLNLTTPTASRRKIAQPKSGSGR